MMARDGQPAAEKTLLLTGNHAVAWAARLARPQVVPVYPITPQTPVLEKKDALKKRIDEAAKFVPLDDLCLSPQCGFASSEVGNKLSEDDQRRKLELAVQVAKEVWG